VPEADWRRLWRRREQQQGQGSRRAPAPESELSYGKSSPGRGPIGAAPASAWGVRELPPELMPLAGTVIYVRYYVSVVMIDKNMVRSSVMQFAIYSGLLSGVRSYRCR
jgi:hypothetical protein